jgi:uncharacterized membrane protein YhaH (DUF805 family)
MALRSASEWLQNTLKVSGTIGRTPYFITLAVITMIWALMIRSYYWMVAFIPSQGSVWFTALVVTLAFVTLSSAWRRMRDTNWPSWIALLPTLPFLWPYLIWVLMIAPNMISGKSYTEAMKVASQDGGLQIIVTFVGSIAPIASLLAFLLLLIPPTRRRSQNVVKERVSS